MQKNTPALTWHQISCKFFACKLSSLGPGAELLPQATEIRPRAGRSPPAERVDLRSVCGLPFQHAPFPRSRSGFCSILFFSRRIPSWIPPFPSLVGRVLVTFWLPFGWVWVFFFRCVFLERFWTFFDASLTDFWGYVSMFFAYFFELCFCLHFARIYFKWMRTFKRLDLQKTLFFLVKTLF